MGDYYCNHGKDEHVGIYRPTLPCETFLQFPSRSVDEALVSTVCMRAMKLAKIGCGVKVANELALQVSQLVLKSNHLTGTLPSNWNSIPYVGCNLSICAPHIVASTLLTAISELFFVENAIACTPQCCHCTPEGSCAFTCQCIFCLPGLICRCTAMTYSQPFSGQYKPERHTLAMCCS